MSFVQRKDGAIVGCYGLAQPGFAEEVIADDNPEVIAFLTPPVVIDKRALAVEAVLVKISESADAPQAVKDYIGNKQEVVFEPAIAPK